MFGGHGIDLIFEMVNVRWHGSCDREGVFDYRDQNPRVSPVDLELHTDSVSQISCAWFTKSWTRKGLLPLVHTARSALTRTERGGV